MSISKEGRMDIEKVQSRGMTRRSVGERILGVLSGLGIGEVIRKSERMNRSDWGCQCGGVLFHTPEVSAQGPIEKPPSFPRLDGTGIHFYRAHIDAPYPVGYSADYEVLDAAASFGIRDETGAPESRPWTDEHGNRYQLFPYGVIQKTPDGRFQPFPLYGWLSQNGFDELLESKLVPAPRAILTAGKTPTQVQDAHLAVLDEHEPLRTHFFSQGGYERYGLPQALADYGPVVVLRTPTSAWQFWKEPQRIVPVGIAQILREKTTNMMKLVPIKSLVGELSHRGLLTWAPRDIPDLPLVDNINGSEPFVSRVRRTLEYIAEKAPKLYQELITQVKYIEERQPKGVVSAAEPSNGTILLQQIDRDRELDEQDIFESGYSIIHEAGHIYLHAVGLYSGGLYGEAFCVSKEIEYAQSVRLSASIAHVGENAIARRLQTLDRIDIPERQWWRVPFESK